jgi:hypothetical protein
MTKLGHRFIMIDYALLIIGSLTGCQWCDPGQDCPESLF